MIELMIADDNVHYTEHLNYVLTKEKNFKVVNISHNGLETVMNYNALKPDILLLDLDMPGIDGISVIDKLTDDKKNIIIISGCPELRSQIKNTHRIEWILDKTISNETLVNIIKSVGKSLNINKFDSTITDLLNILKFNPLSKGTIYLKDALLIASDCYNHKNIHIDYIMKQVAAKNREHSYKNVRSTIDKCIASTFNKHTDMNLFYKLFPDFDGYKPSTGRFMEYMLNYLDIALCA